jgi:hypothetical protein
MPYHDNSGEVASYLSWPFQGSASDSKDRGIHIAPPFLIGQVSKDYETIQNGKVNQSVKITVKTM